MILIREFITQGVTTAPAGPPLRATPEQAPRVFYLEYNALFRILRSVYYKTEQLTKYITS
jgi:hypothetical protein